MFNNGLNPFILDPQLYPNEVVFYDANVSIIYDKYPKSVVHFLVLPRDYELTEANPFAVLSDPNWVDLLNPYVLRAKLFAAMHLKAIKNDADTKGIQFPPDLKAWNEYLPFLDRIKTGFHAVPSMANLHIHIVSSDLHSPAMRRFNHYNSFVTEFFVPFTGKADPDLRVHQSIDHAHRYLDICHHSPLVCHTCHKQFEKFSSLQKHLEIEYTIWKSS